MNVVHLTTTDFGGAYKACERIHESLLLQGINSVVLVRKKVNSGTVSSKVYQSNLKEICSKICNFLNLLLSYNDVISDYFGLNYTHNKEIMKSDVIVLHWINSFISYKNAKRLLRLGKPVIWVLHDMWLLTGGCHYDNYCGEYSNGCKKCRRVKGFFRKKIVTSNVYKKYEMTHAGNLFLIGPSNWIISEAERSFILKGIPMMSIPNPINTNIYHKKENCNDLRRKYNIAAEKKVILFGADNPKRDLIKGERFINELLGLLDPVRYTIFVFGGSSDIASRASNYESKFLGFISDENTLAEIYNVADVFCAPSTQECFGYTTAEALHCGTPVVAFNIGGHAEQIVHKRNGYLAPLDNVMELARGIEFCTQDGFEFESSCIDYSYKSIGGMYAQLLSELN